MKSSLAPDSGNSITSATNHMYQSVAKLIKLCDDVLVDGDESAALNEDNVQEVVELVEKAVQVPTFLRKKTNLHIHSFIIVCRI